jgi:ABC-type transporter Mla subunit MlaD
MMITSPMALTSKSNRGMLAPSLAILLLAGAGVIGGCASAGIAMRETMGIPKREQLVDRVGDARDAQTEAKEQFASALEEFMAVTGAQGGDLEAKYKSLNREFERSKDRADDVRSRITSVETVAEKLFSEWRVEMEQYSSASLRSKAERQYDATRREYDSLIQKMKAASAKMDPVLTAFNDQVLYLKHNLNARAIASLQDTASEIQSDVARLVQEMEASISEANAFIDSMQGPEEAAAG